MGKEGDLEVVPTTPPSDGMGHDPEKPAGGSTFVPEDFREKDFMTRNGLNLKSFSRRMLSFLPPTPHGVSSLLTQFR
jgi:amino acid transporter